ncbi:MAG: ABC transporter ATP-binding protein [Actinobacteria bacterium]|nr:ABC transporter ATP-binding protein [Actinomycetota bacterium]NDE66630.1 ABC transporter ATP-binding protein [Actinomycetota bacterium]
MFGMGAGVAPEDQLDRTQTRRVLGRVLRMAYPFRRTAYVALGCVVVTTAATLAAPILVRHGIDAGIRAGDFFELNLSVGLYLAITALAYGFGRLQYVFLNRTGEAFLRELRLKVFAALQRQSMAFYDRNKAGVLVARMTADIETMGELIQWGLLQFLASGFLVVLAFVVLFSLSWQLTLVVLIVFPVIVIASVKFQRDSNTAYLSVRERVGQNLGTLQEGIAAVRVIQAYAQEDHQIKRFERSNRSLFDSHVRSIRISTWYFGLVEFSGVFAASLVVGVGGWLVHRDTVSLGTVVAFILLLSSLFDPVQQLSQLYNGVQSAAAALHKLYAILDHKPEVDEAADAIDLPARGELIVQGVTFKYQAGTQPALQSAELIVADGERIALVGPTGAGKSTLAKLMARLYDPTVGSVSYGGVDLRQATLASLRQRIVVVPQEGFLFNGTIRENVRLARVTASDAEVESALSRLGILDHFERLPEGLDTEVRERGSRLSAGERQLVALGRAALVDPAVLVLDEATSNLDPGTEAEVEAALERLMQGRTTIVVAHRLTTVQRADRIVVVDKAHIAEVGSHRDLLERGGKYAALARAWEKSHSL